MIVWGVQLKDSVSMPANAAAQAMGTAAQRAKTLEGAMKSAQASLAKFQALGDAAGVRKASANVLQLKEALDSTKPPFTALTDASGKLKEVWAGLGDVALVAEAGFAAASAAALALGAAVYEGAKIAIEATENLRRLNATFDALGEDGAHAGRATVAMLRDLEKEIPQSEATIASWARTLEGAGMTDLGQLRSALKATASAEALVEGGGERVKNLLAKLNEQSMKGGGKVKFSLAQLAGTGVTEPEFMRAIGMTPTNFAAAKKAGALTGKSVNDAIVKALETKATGPLAAQMNDLATIETKAAEGAKRLFEDVDTGPFTSGLKSFFSVFDEANPSGQVLKATITTAFNAVFQVAGRVFEFLRVAFLHMMIWGLQVAIALKPIVKEFMAWANAHGVISALETGLKMMGVAVLVVVGVLGGLVVAAAVVAGALLAIQVAATAAGWWLLSLLPKAGEALGDLAFRAVQAGKDFVEGLANGIRNGVGMVVDAAKNLAGAAWKSVKETLGIHSPSTVMFQMGAHTAGGFTAGMQAGKPDAESAGGFTAGMQAGKPDAESAGAGLGMAATAGVQGRSDQGVGMSSASASQGRGARAPAAGGGGGGASFTFGDITLSLGGTQAPAPAELRGIVEEGLASLAERLAAMVGSAPDPA